MNTPNPPSPSPITEADLHALVDGQLTATRAREVEEHLAAHPEDALRVGAWRAQKQGLHALYGSVVQEPIPQRLRGAADARSPWLNWRVAASFAMALLAGAAGWELRGQMDGAVAASHLTATSAIPSLQIQDFAQRAAVAHAVYVPDQRRPVEISGDHEDQLVTWLSKRTGVQMKPPSLQALGYRLQGGRLLPGEKGPVAQFMYQDQAGMRLTLYVSNDLPRSIPDARASTSERPDTAFRFAQEGPINTFYWVDGSLGYALSSYAGRADLERVSSEVYRQLEGTR